MIPPNLDGGYSCNECNYSCSSWTKLKHHILPVHEGYLYKCTKCEEQFGSVTKTESHHVEKHGKATFRCEVCEKSFTEKKNLRKHQQEEIKLKCEECKFIGCNKRVLAVHAKMHNSHFKDGFFNCSFCPYRHKKKSRIVHHEKDVHGDVKEYCDQCNFKSSRKAEVVQHKKVKHEGLRFKCDRCDYTANRSYSVSHHNAVKHNGFRYQCSLCDYKSISTKGLQDHIIAAHEKTAFSCPFCPVQVFYKDSLQRHIKQHAKMKLETVETYEVGKNEENKEFVEKKEPQKLIESQKSNQSEKINETQIRGNISQSKEEIHVAKPPRRKRMKKVKIISKPSCVSTTCCRTPATKDATSDNMESLNEPII